MGNYLIKVKFKMAKTINDFKELFSFELDPTPPEEKPAKKKIAKYSKKAFLKLFPKACRGTGGFIFHECFTEEMSKKRTLMDLYKEIVNEMKEDGGSINLDESDLSILLNLKVSSNKDIYKFFVKCLHDYICGYPELCGTIVACMCKEKMFNEATRLIGLNIVDEDDEEDYLCWDS